MSFILSGNISIGCLSPLLLWLRWITGPCTCQPRPNSGWLLQRTEWFRTKGDFPLCPFSLWPHCLFLGVLLLQVPVIVFIFSGSITVPRFMKCICSSPEPFVTEILFQESCRAIKRCSHQRQRLLRCQGMISSASLLLRILCCGFRFRTAGYPVMRCVPVTRLTIYCTAPRQV